MLEFLLVLPTHMSATAAVQKYRDAEGYKIFNSSLQVINTKQ